MRTAQLRLSAFRWKYGEKNEVFASKVFLKNKIVSHIVLDPNMETADIDVENNVFPSTVIESRFDQYREKQNN